MASTARMRMPTEPISCGIALPRATASWALICSGSICCAADEGTTQHFLTIVSVQQLVSLVDTELPFRVMRDKSLRAVNEITGRDPGAPVDMCLNRGTVDQQSEGVDNRGIAERRVLRLCT